MRQSLGCGGQRALRESLANFEALVLCSMPFLIGVRIFSFRRFVEHDDNVADLAPFGLQEGLYVMSESLLSKTELPEM